MPDSPLDRLKAFRDGWDKGDLVDESSGLTCEDIDRVIELVKGAEVLIRSRKAEPLRGN